MKVIYNGKTYLRRNKIWYDSSYIQITQQKILKELEEYIKNNDISMDIEDVHKQVLFKYYPQLNDNITNKIKSTFKYNNMEHLGFFIGNFRKKYKKLDLKNIILCVAPGCDSIECNEGNLEKFVEEIGRTYNCKIQLNLLLRKYPVEKTAFVEKNERNFEKQYTRQIESIKINEKIDVKGKEILIIDDIKVTGGTISACEKILKEAGVKRVYYFVISETKYYNSGREI